MFLLVLSCLCFCAVARCSIIFDKLSQNTVHVSDYCPKIKGCDDGTHVVCMYYDPKHVMSQICAEGRNFTVTPGSNLANTILNFINGMRGKVAQGIETGEADLLLPKGYGMFRVEWDNELATLAQLWANQCKFGHDLCRATKKFHKSGQVISLQRYKYPNWESFDQNNDDKDEIKSLDDLIMDRVKEAVNNSINNIYSQKQLLSKDMVNSGPNFSRTYPLHQVRLYSQIIQGSVTHVGCGISTYVGYDTRPGIKDFAFNTVALVCNFSDEPGVGQKIYETHLKEGHTAKCGCPPGYYEDKNCLCARLKFTNSALPVIPHCTTDGQCSPRVVILPIVAVEDSPPEKLYQRRFDNFSALRDDSWDIFNNVKAQRKLLLAAPKSTSYVIQNPNIIKINTPYQLNKRISDIDKKRLTDVKKRYFNKNADVAEQRHRIGSLVQSTRNDIQNRTSIRNSIFTRTSKFELPSQTQLSKHGAFLTETYKSRGRLTEIKKDVMPRRDFTKLHSLVKAYLSKKHRERVLDRSMNNNFSENFANNVIPIRPKFSFENFNITVSKRNSGIRTSCEDSDNKLLNLLDNLEQQVKHAELNDNLKEMVDAKIRNIFSNVADNPNKLTKSMHFVNEDNFIENAERRSNISPINVEVNQRILDTPILESKIYGPLKRNQNSLYEKPIYENYKRKYTIFDSGGREVNANVNNLGKNDLLHIKDVKPGDLLTDGNYYKTNDNEGRCKKLYDKLETDNYYLTKKQELSLMNGKEKYRATLDKLERKLQSMRSYRRRNDLKKSNQFSRPVQILQSGFGRAGSTNLQPLYISNRAKFLHGF